MKDSIIITHYSPFSNGRERWRIKDLIEEKVSPMIVNALLVQNVRGKTFNWAIFPMIAVSLDGKWRTSAFSSWFQDFNPHPFGHCVIQFRALKKVTASPWVTRWILIQRVTKPPTAFYSNIINPESRTKGKFVRNVQTLARKRTARAMFKKRS